MTDDQAQRPTDEHATGSPAANVVRIPLNFSMAGLFALVAFLALGSAYVITLQRLRKAESELTALRLETGYLEPTADNEIAAARLTSDQPMTYRVRVRVPPNQRYRITYSSLWPQSQSEPQWYGAVSLPAGESIVTVRVLKDSRDDQWKIATLRRGVDGTRRIATVLPKDHVKVFRGSHDWLRSGVSQRTESKPIGEAIRLLDERVLVGEGAMMLYGDKPPADDMIGVFAELQPDIGPI